MMFVKTELLWRYITLRNSEIYDFNAGSRRCFEKKGLKLMRKQKREVDICWNCKQGVVVRGKNSEHKKCLL